MWDQFIELSKAFDIVLPDLSDFIRRRAMTPIRRLYLALLYVEFTGDSQGEGGHAFNAVEMRRRNAQKHHNVVDLHVNSGVAKVGVTRCCNS